MPQTPINGTTINHEVFGDRGTPILLIMGLIVPGRAWRHQTGVFAEHHRVAWFDNRGVGASEVAPGPYTMEMFADDGLGVMDHLGWDDAHVVGVSMGGMIAQNLALRAPERVRSLTLIATHAGGRGAVVPPVSGVRWLLKSMLGTRSWRRKGLERLLFPKAFLRSCDRTWLTEVLREDFGTYVPRHVLRAQLGAVRGHNTQKDLAQLSGFPSLVICAEQDLLVRPKLTRDLHRGIPGAELFCVPDAGHGVIRQSFEGINEKMLLHFAAADREMK
jgi:3-oxoadipate enol-lactonase